MVSIGNSACFDAVSEKRLLQRLNHPFITKLYGALSDKKCLYFLSEYCAGGDLYTRVVELEETEKKLMSEEVVRYIIACVLETLVYLHSLQIVYRDLKPENIVLSGKGDQEAHFHCVRNSGVPRAGGDSWTRIQPLRR